MPQGGGATVADAADGPGGAASAELFQAIRQGTSWSGNESNHFFLSSGSNKNTPIFTDVSSASGFDFPDDGRGMTPVDWDADGDLDVFVSNRNGPQIRLLRNDIPTGDNQFLAIQLSGNGSVNRDAIGARVTLHFVDQPPLIRTLRAGEGFQCQNSKWLHFGLGEAAQILKVTIDWPGADQQIFTDIVAGKRYRLTHGVSQPEPEPTRNFQWPNPLIELKIPTVVTEANALTPSRLPVPELPYFKPNGIGSSIQPTKFESPVLVNLWASWCAPCLEEIRQFKQEQKSFEKSGLRIITLTVDGVGGQPGDANQAQAFMDKLGQPFEYGIATPELLEKIELLHDLLFEKRSPMVVPTSILIDHDGRLAGYFEGSISPAELIKYVEYAELSKDSDRLAQGLPFPGRWLAAPLGFRLTDYGSVLIKHDYFRDAVALYDRHQSEFFVDTTLAKFLVQLGFGFEQRGDLTAAVKYLDRAVKFNPENAQGHAQLGIKFSQLKRFAEAEQSYRMALAIDPSLVDTRFNMSMALKHSGRERESLDQLMIVVTDSPQHAYAHANIAAHMMKTNQPDKAIEHLRLTLAAKPDFHAVRFQLANLLESSGKKEEAIAEYKALLAINPNFVPALERLKKLDQ